MKINTKKLMFFMPLAAIVPLCLANNSFTKVNAEGEEIVVNKDNTSEYSPTQIINGDFENPESSAYACNSTPRKGVDEGWTTTDSWFERLGPAKYSEWGVVAPADNGYFAEMNADHPGTLYQDLTTYSGDVIRWTLDHAARCDGDSVQSLEVQIGGSDGNDPCGIDNEMNTHIDPSTKATFSSTGVTNPEGKTYGFGNLDELANLAVNQLWDDNPWYNAKGVYMIPEGQSVTRFAFVSTTQYNPSLGNLIDNVTFSTLIGNLKAVYKDGGDVSVFGYWGDDNAGKSLIIKIGETINNIDMSGVLNSNFIINIPASLIGDATKVDVYHEDYEAAKKTITIEGPTIDPVGPNEPVEPNNNDKGKGLTGGAVAGIVIGCLFLLLLIIYILGYLFLYRKGKLDDKAIRVIYKFLPRGDENKEEPESSEK